MKTKQLINSGRLLAFLFLFSGISIAATAQKGGDAPFVKGSKSLGLSVGAGIDYDYYGDYNALPAIALTYDQGIINNAGPGTIGVGGIVAVKSAYYNYKSGGYRARWNNYFVGVRGTYHLTLLASRNNKFDPYAGVTAGVRVLDYKDDAFVNNPRDYNNVEAILGGFVGARYNFARSFGAFAEVGYDISYGRVGIAVNF